MRRGITASRPAFSEFMMACLSFAGDPKDGTYSGVKSRQRLLLEGPGRCDAANPGCAMFGIVFQLCPIVGLRRRCREKVLERHQALAARSAGSKVSWPRTSESTGRVGREWCADHDGQFLVGRAVDVDFQQFGAAGVRAQRGAQPPGCAVVFGPGRSLPR